MTSEPEKVQQVAEALREQCKQEFGATWSYDVAWRLARAAIGAMREPTDAQLAAFTRSCDTQGQCLVKYGYTAMIDAALSQTIGEK